MWARNDDTLKDLMNSQVESATAIGTEKSDVVGNNFSKTNTNITINCAARGVQLQILGSCHFKAGLCINEFRIRIAATAVARHTWRGSDHKHS